MHRIRESSGLSSNRLICYKTNWFKEFVYKYLSFLLWRDLPLIMSLIIILICDIPNPKHALFCILAYFIVIEYYILFALENTKLVALK